MIHCNNENLDGCVFERLGRCFCACRGCAAARGQDCGACTFEGHTDVHCVGCCVERQNEEALEYAARQEKAVEEALGVGGALFDYMCKAIEGATGFPLGPKYDVRRPVREAQDKAREEEREICARIAEAYDPQCAEKIRALTKR